MQDNKTERLYDVFVSYAHDDLPKIKPVISALSEAGIAVLDPFSNQKEMWGSNLYTWFSEVFPASAKIAMIFFSRNYSKSSWCKRELEYVLSSARDNPYLVKVLPIRLDNSPVPQEASDVVFIDLAQSSPKEIAELTKQQLRLVEASSNTELALMSDEDLIERIAQERDQAAFNILYKRIYPRILRYITWYQSRHDLEQRYDLSIDVVSDVLVRVWQQASRFSRQETSFDHWIAALTTQALLDNELNQQRKPQNREVLVPFPKDVELEAGKDVLSPYWSSPERVAEIAELMNKIFKKLEPAEKQLLELYINGNSASDIAEILGLSPSVVRLRISRLMARLRSKIVHGEHV